VPARAPGMSRFHDIGRLRTERIFYAMKMVRQRLDATRGRALRPGKAGVFSPHLRNGGIRERKGHFINAISRRENIMVGRFGEVWFSIGA